MVFWYFDKNLNRNRKKCTMASLSRKDYSCNVKLLSFLSWERLIYCRDIYFFIKIKFTNAAVLLDWFLVNLHVMLKSNFKQIPLSN